MDLIDPGKGGSPRKKIRGVGTRKASNQKTPASPKKMVCHPG